MENWLTFISICLQEEASQRREKQLAVIRLTKYPRHTMNASATVNVILTCHAARTQGQTTRSVFLTKTTCFRKRNPISPLVAGRKCTIKTKATFFICHSPPLFLFQFLRRQLIKASHEKIELSTHESKS